MSNGQGEDADRIVQMRLYDALPKVVREALANAPIGLGAASPTRWLYKYDALETAQIVKESTRDYMLSNEVASTKTIWTWKETKAGKYGIKFNAAKGEDHPQADREYPWPDYQVWPRRNRTRVVNLRGKR